MKKSLLISLSAAALAFMPTVANAGRYTKTIDIRGVQYKLDTVFHAKVGPGTTQTQLQLTGPTSNLQVFYLTIDKTTPGVSMRAVCATDKVGGTATPSSMAKSKSKDGLSYFAGTNGDFYSTSGNATNGSSFVGRPTTSCTVDREVYKTSNSNYQFTIDTDGNAHVGRLNYYTGTATLGDKVTLFKGVNVMSPSNGLTIYTPRYFGTTNNTDRAEACAEVTAKLVEGDNFYAGGKYRMEITSTATTDGDRAIPSDGYVIHGNGTSTSGCNTSAIDFVKGLKVGDIVEFDQIILLNDKRIYPAQIVSGNPKNVGGGETLDTESERGDASSLHPRTSLGVSQSGDSIIMMVIDGRTPNSAGVRTSMLADVMRYAGAYEALNVDGGGSSTLYTQALGVRNNCSDGKERAVGNAIFAVLEAPEDDTVAEIQFKDWVMEAPKYGAYTPTIYAYNKYGKMINTDLKGFTLSCPAGLGEIINDSTLFAIGEGTHALTATYNGVSATIPVTISTSGNAELKYDSVLIDNFREWPVDVQAMVNTTYMPLNPRALSWSSADASIATVDDLGIVKGKTDGTTELTGVFGENEYKLNLTVQCPTAHTMAIDPEVVDSTWSKSVSGVKELKMSKLPMGFALDFTISSSRSSKITLSKEIKIWSLPDTIQIRVNPGATNVTDITLNLIPNNGRAVTTKFANIEANKENILSIPVSAIGDPNDIGIYPILFKSMSIVPKGSVNAVAHIDVTGFEAVYKNIPDAGVEDIFADEENMQGLIIAPNPVAQGEVATINASDNANWEIYSITGALVAKGTGNQLSTNSLVSGSYVVKVVDNGYSSAAQLIIK